jgi:hypothetical protein
MLNSGGRGSTHEGVEADGVAGRAKRSVWRPQLSADTLVLAVAEFQPALFSGQDVDSLG